MALDPLLPATGPAGSPIQVTAAQFRRLDIATTMVHETHDIAARAGVCAGLNATVAGTTVTVAPGSAIVTPTVTANGSYRVSVGTATALTLAARDATYSRYDLIVLRVYDSEADASGQYAAALELVTGTPAASPVTPTAPAGALTLWAVTVPPSGTVTVADSRVWTSALGGVITCTSTTRPSGSALRPGQEIYETDTQTVRVWTGSAWLLVASPAAPTAMATGTLSVSFASTTVSAAEVNFPAGRFTVAPVVVAGCTDYGHRFVVRAGNVRVGAFTLNVMTATSSSFTGTANISWIAVQM